MWISRRRFEALEAEVYRPRLEKAVEEYRRFGGTSHCIVDNNLILVRPSLRSVPFSICADYSLVNFRKFMLEPQKVWWADNHTCTETPATTPPPSKGRKK